MLNLVEAALVSKRPDIQPRGDSGNKSTNRQKAGLLESWRVTRNLVSPVIDPALVRRPTGVDRHPPESDLTTPLKIALDQLIESLSGIHMAVSNTNRSGFVWGRASVLKKISEYLGPVLDQAISEGSLAWTTLRDARTPFPFAKQVSAVGNLPLLTRNMILARDALDFWMETGGTDLLQVRYQGECLNTAAAILEALSSAFDIQTYHWCDICFRRAVKKYCREHKRTDKTGTGVQQKARRIKKMLSPQTTQLLVLYRSRRRSIGENVQLVSDPNSIPHTMSSDWRAITVHPMVEALADHKLALRWPECGEHWDGLLASMPFLFQRLQQQPSAFESWEKFSRAILNIIADTEEKTTHPYWVLQIAILAERWFEAEQKITDRRTTPQSAEIKKLLEDGMKQSEIAKRLGVTKAAVSKAYLKMKAR